MTDAELDTEIRSLRNLLIDEPEHPNAEAMAETLQLLEEEVGGRDAQSTLPMESPSDTQTLSSPSQAPSVPTRTEADVETHHLQPRFTDEVRRTDAATIMGLVQQVHVDDSEESQILEVVAKHAVDPQSFRAFLQALNNRAYWGGWFNQHYRTGVQAIFQELEGERHSRLIELIQTRLDSRSRDVYMSYADSEELSFAESFWQDVASGQVRDQIFAYFQGMGDAGIAMAESIILLVTRPEEFARGLAQLPEAIVRFWENREELWRSFLNASPTEQARIIGRVIGEAELFLASTGAGAGTSGAARTGMAPATAVEIQVVGRGQAALTMTRAPALTGARLGPTVDAATQMTLHTSQLESGTRSAQRATERSERTSARRSPESRSAEALDEPSTTRPESRRAGAEEGSGSRTTEDVFDELWRELDMDPSEGVPEGGRVGERTRRAVEDARDAGFITETGGPGSVDAAFQPHRRARDVREALGVSGYAYESAHVGATSFLRRVTGYSRSGADTVILPRSVHRTLDSHWKDWARRQRRAGRTRVSTMELYDVMVEALNQTPGLTQRTRNTIAYQLELEIRQLGLSMDDMIDLPYPNIRPSTP